MARSPDAGKPSAPAAEPALPTVTVTAPRFSTDLDSFLNEPGDYRFAIQHAGLTRTYRVHVPVRYDRTEPAPLLVALHGNGHTMDDPAIDAYYGLVGKSEREGFIAVFPNAAATPGHARQPTWNRDNVDDVGFVRQVVTNVFRQVSISRNRIYATGVASGGTLAYRLACELPGVFRAVATVATADDAGGCTAGKPVSVLHIQARNDPGRPPAAASRRKAKWTPAGLLPGKETAARWAEADGCSPMPRNVLDADGVSCQQWSWCRAQAEVQLCVTDSGGRSWPGGRSAIGGDTPSTALSATDTMWAFFSRH